MNKADLIYKQNLLRILCEGTWDENPRPKYEDGTPAYSKFITQVFEEYDLTKGELPITTLRPIGVKTSINELLAIYQTQTNSQEGFEGHNISWWKPWMNDDGNIGRAYSYNLESHRPNEMKREVVEVERRIIDRRYGELQNINLVNPLQESTDGKVYFNRYIVIGESDRIDSKNRKFFFIQFLNTGHIAELRCDQIGVSKSLDPYERTNFGVGFLGNYKIVSNFSEKQISILKDKWENMLRRCYSENYEHKDSYTDTFVHNDWHSFEQFLRDVRYLPQYHLAKEDNFSGWDLDKDYFSSNCYSVDTCVFLKHSENSLYSKAKPFIYDKHIYISQADFADKFDTSQTAVSRALKKGKFRSKEIEFITDDKLYRYELSRNQLNELIKGLKKDPYGRRHMMSFFNWSNQDKKMLVECAFQTLWSVRKMGEFYYLDLTLVQRSSDYVVAGHINMMQYVALQMMVAHEVGMTAGKFARVTQNLHIYDRHIEQVHELLNREPSDAKPFLKLHAKGKGFYDITADDFELINYYPVKPQLKFDLGI